MPEEKKGGAGLLDSLHNDLKNPWGHPVVGWKPTSQGEGWSNAKAGFATMRIVLWKTLNDAKQWLYDQFVIIENPGVIVIPTMEVDGTVFVLCTNNYRMIGPRIIDTPDYIKHIESEGLWKQLIESLGQSNWETPRGIAPQHLLQGDNVDLTEHILKTAKLEALEEAGAKVDNVTIVGQVHLNPTFFPHPQYVARANVIQTGEASPEDLEIIDGRKFFSLDQLADMVKTGTFTDGPTLAALAMCGLQLPV